MTTYWCVWCGEVTERRSSKRAPQCTRCITEFQLAFGFPLRTLMIPIEERAPWPAHASLTKRFTFKTPDGEHVWTTSLNAYRDEPPGHGEELPVDDSVFTIYDIGA